MENSSLTTEQLGAKNSRKATILTGFLFALIGLFVGSSATFFAVRTFVCDSTLLLNRVKLLEQSLAETTKCQHGWVYLAKTNSCYLYQNATYNETGFLNTYLWETAEENCLRHGAHLVSIHSQAESKFVKKLIKSWFTKPDPRLGHNIYHPLVPCGYLSDRVWSGLYKKDGPFQWTDGTPNRYLYEKPSEWSYAVDWRTEAEKNKDTRFSMCHDRNNENDILLRWESATDRHSRYVCKKSADPLLHTTESS